MKNAERIYLVNIFIMIIMNVIMKESVAQGTFFQKSINFDGKTEPGKILVCEDGSYLVTGNLIDKESLISSAYCSKFTQEGSVLWTKKYGSKEGNTQNALIAQISSDEFVFGLSAFRANSSGFCLSKMDALGKILNTTCLNYSNFYASKLFKSSDGNIVLAGRIVSSRDAILILKLNKKFEVLWTKIFQFGSGKIFFDITTSNDKGFLIVQNIPPDEYGKIAVMKLSQNGEVVWQYKYGDNNDVVKLKPSRITELKRGDFLISGSLNSPKKMPALIKFDKEGSVIWSKGYETFYTNNENVLLGSTEKLQTLFCCVGKTNGKGGDVYINCVDNSGEILWSKSYGTEKWEVPHDFKAFNDFYIATSSQHDSLVSNTYFLKSGLNDKSNCNVKDVKIKSMSIAFDFIETLNFYTKDIDANFIELEIVDDKISGVNSLCE